MFGGRYLSVLFSIAFGFSTSADSPAPKPFDAKQANQAAPSAKAKSIDAATGLIESEGFVTVRANCTVCHSARLITQQRATRSGWLEMIRWMQATQNLWPLDPTTETTILDYLATHYAPSGSWRRAPLPPSQRPPNPYSASARAPSAAPGRAP